MVAIQSASSSKRKGSRTHLIWIVVVVISYLAGFQTGLITTHSVQSNPLAAVPGTQQLVLHPANSDPFKLAFDQSYGFFDDIDEYNWKLMQERARSRVNHKFQSNVKFYDEPARWYMNNFEPDFTCAQERRVGGPGDGPKWVCDPHRLPKIADRRLKATGDPKKSECLIYSVGSGGKWQFEDGMFEMHNGLCEIHVFDPGNFAKDRSDLVSRNIIFHKWGFRSSYDSTYKPVVNYGEFFTMQQTLERLGHVGRTIDIFKIDCEYCEWFSFRDWFKEDVDIRMLLVETHGLPENKQMALDYFYGFQQANFYLYHKEPNIHPKAAGNGIEWAYIKLHPDFGFNDTSKKQLVVD